MNGKNQPKFPLYFSTQKQAIFGSIFVDVNSLEHENNCLIVGLCLHEN
jgi:hypothetical protein